MTDENAIEDEAKAAAEAAVDPGTFDFAATVVDRAYPEFNVPLYLDERDISEYLEAKLDIVNLEKRVLQGQEQDAERAQALLDADAKLEAVIERLKGKQYVVRVKGISTDLQQKLLKEAYEKFPAEYDEFTNPMSGVVTRTEKENEERDEYFTARLRQEHLVSVTAPNGAKDEAFEDFGKVKTIFAQLPPMGRYKIDEAINKSSIAVDYYNLLTDEVF